jgi:hypothetical protein
MINSTALTAMKGKPTSRIMYRSMITEASHFAHA